MGKKAVCTLCSQCSDSDYESGWCANNCRQYGERTQVSRKGEIGVNNALKNCIAGSQPWVPYYCVKQQFREKYRRLEDEDEEERELGAHLAPLGGFSDACQQRLTKANGQAKSGKKAVCTLCSQCSDSDYESGWCANNCRQYGERTQVSRKGEIGVNNALKNCIAGSQPWVPYYCVKQQFREKYRRLEDEDEEERELGAHLAPLG